ncbi:MAG: dihydropyrimidinase, partial [Clostridiales bacterium]|nr:dihydropyrimidinase [Clostridiales bacterium]
ALTASMLHEKTDYTPFEGLVLDRKIGMTVSRGEIIAENNTFIGDRKRGHLLNRSLPASVKEL